MKTHDELEAVLDTDEEVLSVIDINIEFPLEGVVHQYACLHADLVVLGVPISLVGDWDTVPSVWIHMSKSLTYAFDDSLGQHVGFLVQVMVVGVWIVEPSAHYWHDAHWLLWVELSGVHNSHGS